MSDEDDKLNDHEFFQRETSPELRWLELFSKMEQRLTRGEERAEQRTEFILEQHAQLAGKVDALAEAQTRTDERWAQTEGSIRDLLAIVQLQAGEVSAVTTALGDVTAAVRAIDERTRHSDERLDALIGVVERLVSNRTNGHSSKTD